MAKDGSPLGADSRLVLSTVSGLGRPFATHIQSQIAEATSPHTNDRRGNNKVDYRGEENSHGAALPGVEKRAAIQRKRMGKNSSV